MQLTVPATRVRARADRWSDRQVLVGFVALAVLLRLPFLTTPLGIDEGGYAYVASHWGVGEGGMYGAQWVDRPPLLLAMYAVAVGMAGDVGVRLLGCIAAAVTVAACAGAARAVAGRTAMMWGAAAATILTANTLIQSHTVNAELPAIACTSVATWLTIVAVRQAATCGRYAGAAVFALGAGLAAASAVLVKQSFVDGLVFAGAALAAVTVLQRGRGREVGRVPTGRLAAAGGTGVLIVLAFVIIWAEWIGPGTQELVAALYGFRIEARDALDGASAARGERAVLLGALVALSGMLALLAFVWIGLARILVGRQQLPAHIEPMLARATASGLLAMGAFGVLAVSQGGNWWRHYLIQLVPMLAIALGIVIAAGPGVRRSIVARRSAQFGTLVAALTVLAWASSFAWSATVGSQRAPAATADWLRAAAHPTDTAFIAWGHANVLERSGLSTPYPHLWSLPIRVYDPQLVDLRSTMSGPDAPTWIVEWTPFGAWDLDADGSFRKLVRARYEQVSSVCGRSIYRLRTATPTGALPDAPSARACGEDVVVLPFDATW